MKPQTLFHLQLTLRRFLVTVLTFTSVLGFCTSSDAQAFRVESKTPPSVIEAGRFVSLEGRFSLALPQDLHGFSPLSIPTPVGQAQGDIYNWKMKEGVFFAGHADATQLLDDPEMSKRLFAQVRDEMARTWSPHGIKLVSEKPLEFEKHPGVELRFEGPNGFLVKRVYAVSRRLYQTMVVVKNEQRVYEAVAVSVLDSFKLLNESDVATAIKEKAAAAEPDQLPQIPVAPKGASDLQDEGLHGRVKMVLKERQDLPESPSDQRKPTTRDYFNEQGNLTKAELYDFKGNLVHITVYGYIDGVRVSADGHIQHEYNPPPMMRISPSGAAKPKEDPRYAAKYTYQYDEQKRQTEMSIFGNDDKLSMRYVYKYTGRRREEWVYAGGLLNQHYLVTLDEQGNEVERTTFKTFPGSTESKKAYAYEFDSQGNWTKQTVSEWVTKDGRSYYEPSSVYYRTITYYK